MNTQESNRPLQSSGAGPRLVLGAVGIVAIAGLITAFVAVLKGQIQQAEVLRAQWQSQPASAQSRVATTFEPIQSPGRTDSALSGAADAGQPAIISASFNRP